MQLEVPDQARLTANLLNNIAIGAARENNDALHASVAMLRRAVALNPLDLPQRLNLATFLIELGHDDEAEKLVSFVLKHNEKADIGWQVMGIIATNRGRLDEAITCFKRAQETAPQHGQHKFDLAAAYLRAGDWKNGLEAYESRREILPKTGPTPNAPTWQGEKTGHLVIWPDQGYGDLIMFSRFVPWAKERAEKVLFLVQPLLLPLFQGFASIPGVEVTHAIDPTKAYDHQICVASLPLVFGLTPDNVPADPGLLSPSKAEGSPPGGFKIGIAWQGNTAFPGDRMRSIPFREFLPLANDPRNTVYSLQVGPASGDIARARAQRIVRDMSPEIDGEWSHTAALIKNLDLVVSSCTAVPHLAGALGVPTFIMLPQFADWRWLHGRDDTPWYPHTRLFRQTKPGEWASVMDRVLKAVDEMHQRRGIVKLLNQHHEEAAKPYEPEVTDLMRKVLRPGDIFVDVGASVGVHSKLAAELVGAEGKVFAFEPGANVLPALRANLKNFDNVEIFDRPVSNVAGPVTFYLCADNSDGNALWDPGEWPGPHNPKSRDLKQPIEMVAWTLDELAGTLPHAPRLIKIDTEGAEQLVLEGAEELLQRTDRPPFIVAELHEFGLRKLGCGQDSLRRLMESHGYSTFMLFSNGTFPALVPPTMPIKTGLIVNLLFSTPEAIAEAWGPCTLHASSLRTFSAYGLPPDDKTNVDRWLAA